MTDRIVLENARLRVAFDGESGVIVGLTNRVTGQELLDAEAPRDPWRLLAQGQLRGVRARSVHRLPLPGEVPPFAPRSFELVRRSNECITLYWDAGSGVQVEVDASMGARDLHLRPRVTVEDGVLPPESLCYPMLQGLRELEGDDRLVFPLHSGWLASKPLHTIGFAGAYPDGYSGCSLQASGYFAAGVGGFYVATHDPSSTHKGFAFGPHGWLMWHDHWDLRRGKSMDLGYPVVIAALEQGDWREVADVYRSWAIPNAPWCAAGPKTSSARARWLHDEVGLVIWGAPSSLDWSPWYRDYAAAAGTPIHVVAGWDWPAKLPPTTDHWFPPRFHPANLQAWRGHRVTPYMTDLFVSSRDVDCWEPELSFPHYGFPWSVLARAPAIAGGEGSPAVLTNTDFFVCPTSERFAALHEARDLTLSRDHGMDGVCYDISATAAATPRCLRSGHSHAPGWGRHMIDAYRDINRRSHNAVQAATGAYPALGGETMTECLIDSHEFYTARGCAGPLAGLEAYVGGPERPPGEGLELIPFFEAVYHDYGPVREDVQADVTPVQGDIFYWTSARCVLQWGGLLSLCYAMAWPGSGHGRDDAEFIGWDGGQYRGRNLPPDDPGKLAFIGELAAARTGYGNRYLGWGRMRRAPTLETGSVELSFGAEGDDWHAVGIRRQGSWRVPRLLTASWEDADGRVGTFLCNVGPEPLTVGLDPAWGRTVRSRAGERAAPDKLEMSARSMVLIE